MGEVPRQARDDKRGQNRRGSGAFQFVGELCFAGCGLTKGSGVFAANAMNWGEFGSVSRVFLERSWSVARAFQGKFVRKLYFGVTDVRLVGEFRGCGLEYCQIGAVRAFFMGAVAEMLFEFAESWAHQAVFSRDGDEDVTATESRTTATQISRSANIREIRGFDSECPGHGERMARIGHFRTREESIPVALPRRKLQSSHVPGFHHSIPALPAKSLKSFEIQELQTNVRQPRAARKRWRFV